MNFCICVVAHSETDFINAKNKLALLGQEHIYFCDSTRLSRFDFIAQTPNSWILFLDADCTIEKSILDDMLTKLDKKSIIAGVYENPEPSCYLQRVHNFIANTWLTSAYKMPGSSPHLLGGAFLIFSDQNRNLKFVKDHSTLFWGAEDKQLAKQLKHHEYSFEMDCEFKVVHATSTSRMHFLKRAWMQGYNNFLSFNYKDNEASKVKVLKYWVSELAKTDPFLLPLILVHFSILQLGKLAQKIRQLHSKQRLVENLKKRV